MNGLARLTLTAIALGGLAAGTAPASANMAADNARRHPCHFYLHRDLPAPKRCLGYFRDALGPDVYVRGNFVFRSREAFRRFVERGPRGEERMASKEEGRYGSRNEDRYRDHNEDRYAERDQMESHVAPPPPPPAPEESASASGGAGRGAGPMYEGESGGASRGSRVPENRSGGASGY